MAVPAGIAAYFVRHHDPGGFLPMAMGLLLVVNSLALAATLAVRAPWVRSSWRAAGLEDRLSAPELFYFAVSLQYLAQVTGTGIFYSYLRSGERRGGEEGRSRWAPDYLKKKKDDLGGGGWFVTKMYESEAQSAQH